jgi:hypothetical protein
MIKFRCIECGEKMEIKRKMSGKRVRCIECGELTDVPQVPVPRQRTAEEKAFLRDLTQQVERDQFERDMKDAERDEVGINIGWFRTDAGLIGGSFIMVVALVWFFTGLQLGRLFFFPPFLFVIGIIAVVQGVVSHIRVADVRQKRRKKRSPR